MGQRKHKFNPIRQVASICPHRKTISRQLANMIEPSVFGGDAHLRAYFDYLFSTCRTTAVQHGLKRRPVNTGVQNDTRVHGPCDVNPEHGYSVY